MGHMDGMEAAFVVCFCSIMCVAPELLLWLYPGPARSPWKSRCSRLQKQGKAAKPVGIEVAGLPLLGSGFHMIVCAQHGQA